MHRTVKTMAALAIGAALALPGLQLAQGLAPQSAHAAGAGTELVGRWANVNPQTRTLTRVSIFYSPIHQSMEVFAWGACRPAECVLGETPLDVNAVPAKAIYTLGFATKTLTISRAGGQIVVGMHTHFTDRSGRPDSQTYDTMAPASF